MKQRMTRVVAVHFSPGGTGRKVVRKIGQTIAQEANIGFQEINMLKAENRQTKHVFGEDTLVLLVNPTATTLIGMPKEVIQSLMGEKTPCVPIVMYGNGGYGVALKLLRVQMHKRGFVPVAAAAFIGQHTAHPEIATGRPDREDLLQAEAFGKQICKKLFVDKVLELKQPIGISWQKEGVTGILKTAITACIGGYGIKMPTSVKRMTFSDACTGCGACVKHCPVQALSFQNGCVVQDVDTCVGCYACFSGCAQKAIYPDNKLHDQLGETMARYRVERKEPTIFL